MRVFKAISGIAFVILISVLAGCGGGDNSPIPTPKVPQGQSATVEPLFFQKTPLAGPVAGTCSLVSSTAIPSKAPNQLEASALPGTNWIGLIPFGFGNDLIALHLKFTATQVQVSLGCSKTDGSFAISGNQYFSFDVTYDGKVVYLQNAFDLKTEDAQGNFCEASFSGDYLLFSGTSGKVQVLLGNTLYNFTQDI